MHMANQAIGKSENNIKNILISGNEGVVDLTKNKADAIIKNIKFTSDDQFYTVLHMCGPGKVLHILDCEFDIDMSTPMTPIPNAATQIIKFERCGMTKEKAIGFLVSCVSMTNLTETLVKIDFMDFCDDDEINKAVREYAGPGFKVNMIPWRFDASRRVHPQ